jgi:hypothetical protein
MQGKIKATGEVHIKVVGADGRIKHDKTVKNLIVTAGLTLLANRIADATPDSGCLVNYIAVGTDNTAPAGGDTTLGAENARKQVSSRVNSGAVAAISTTFNAGDVPTSTIEELGLFIDGTASADSGTLLARVLDTFAVTALDSVFVDWRITFASA